MVVWEAVDQRGMVEAREEGLRQMEEIRVPVCTFAHSINHLWSASAWVWMGGAKVWRLAEGQ